MKIIKPTTLLTLLLTSGISSYALAESPHPIPNQLETMVIPSPINNAEIRVLSYWSETPTSVCWFKDNKVLGCSKNSDSNWNLKVTSGDSKKGGYEIRYVIPANNLVEGSQNIKVKLCNSHGCGEKSALLKFNNTSPSANTTNAANSSFSYENAVSGLTRAKSKANSAPVTTRRSNLSIGGYVSEWAQYDRHFNLEKISPSSYTDITYAFFGICGDRGTVEGTSNSPRGATANKIKTNCDSLGLPEGSIVSADPWGAYTSAISQRQKNMTDKAYSWKVFGKQDYSKFNSDNVRGLLGQFIWMKKQNPELKLGLSVGGWTMSEPFHRIAADATLRKNMAKSIVSFMKKWSDGSGQPYFSTIDLDWEFPGTGGESRAFNSNDGANYVLLLKEIRAELNSNNLQNIKISIAAGSPLNIIDKVGSNYQQIAGINGAIDAINLMSYDYWGAFENKLGHHTSLLGKTVFNNVPASSQNNIVNAAKKLIDLGVDKSKINIGIANYARGKKADIQTEGKPDSATNISSSLVFGTYESSVLEGYDLFSNITDDTLTGKNGYQPYTDIENGADYFYNPKSGVYWSIDTPRTAVAKAKFAKNNHFKGVFSWTIEQDNNGLIVDSVNTALNNTIQNNAWNESDIQTLINKCGENVTTAACDKINKDSDNLTLDNFAQTTSKLPVKPEIKTVTTEDFSTHKYDVFMGTLGTCTYFSILDTQYGYKEILSDIRLDGTTFNTDPFSQGSCSALYNNQTVGFGFKNNGSLADGIRGVSFKVRGVDHYIKIGKWKGNNKYYEGFK